MWCRCGVAAVASLARLVNYALPSPGQAWRFVIIIVACNPSSSFPCIPAARIPATIMQGNPMPLKIIVPRHVVWQGWADKHDWHWSWLPLLFLLSSLLMTLPSPSCKYNTYNDDGSNHIPHPWSYHCPCCCCLGTILALLIGHWCVPPPLPTTLLVRRHSIASSLPHSSSVAAIHYAVNDKEATTVVPLTATASILDPSAMEGLLLLLSPLMSPPLRPPPHCIESPSPTLVDQQLTNPSNESASLPICIPSVSASPLHLRLYTPTPCHQRRRNIWNIKIKRSVEWCIVLTPTMDCAQTECRRHRPWCGDDAYAAYELPPRCYQGRRPTKVVCCGVEQSMTKVCCAVFYRSKNWNQIKKLKNYFST